MKNDKDIPFNHNILLAISLIGLFLYHIAFVVYDIEDFKAPIYILALLALVSIVGCWYNYYKESNEARP